VAGNSLPVSTKRTGVARIDFRDHVQQHRRIRAKAGNQAISPAILVLVWTALQDLLRNPRLRTGRSGADLGLQPEFRINAEV
jgi:hypothetical protein